MMLFRKIAVWLGCVSFCFLTACNLGSSGSSVPQSVRDWIGRSESWTYDGSEVQYELPDNVRTLNIETDGPVDVFMAKVNFGSEVLPAQSTRYLVSSNLSPVQNQSLENSLNVLPSYANTRSNSSDSTIFYEDSAAIRNIDLTALSVLRNSAGSQSVPEYEPLTPVQKITEELGFKKEVWVDLPTTIEGSKDEIEISDSGDMSSFTLREATLRYIGESCYIWVVDKDNPSITTTKDSITSLGQKFDEIYTLVRGVFGAESDKILEVLYLDDNGNKEWDEGESQIQALVPMDAVCATGSKVNIVVYDISGDYAPDQKGVTMGYFANKDYFSRDMADFMVNATGQELYKTTNGGKYFYVDSSSLMKSVGQLYSVLAHEFQHMIHYGTKTQPGITGTGTLLQSSTWFNEMLSMLCEDMLQAYLKVPDEEAPVDRLKEFCSDYYRYGLGDDWLSGDDVTISYAVSYAFGAYLTRNYGGARLIKQIAINEYVDQESITEALKACGFNETFETVFAKYMQALLLDNPPHEDVKTFNKTADGIEGPMKAINLFNGTIKRPDYLGADAASRVDLRPYGFTLHRLGNSQSGKIQLNFSSPVNKAEKIYILVQPQKQ